MPTPLRTRLRYPITVNATNLGAGTFDLDPDIFAGQFDQATGQPLHLLSNLYGFDSAQHASFSPSIHPTQAMI